MRTTRRVLIAPSLAVVVLAGAGPAFAEDPTPAPTETTAAETAPPAQPEETDLVEGAPETAAPAPSGIASPDPDDDLHPPTSKPSDKPDAQACEPHWQYYPTAKGKDYHKGVGLELANYNGTSRTMKSTFTSEASGTVTLGYTGELKVAAKAAVIEIEGKFGVNLSVSASVKVGVTTSIETPPRTTTFGRFGVYRLKSSGYVQYTYLNCTKGVKENKPIYTPHRIGWAIWEK